MDYQLSSSSGSSSSSESFNTKKTNSETNAKANLQDSTNDTNRGHGKDDDELEVENDSSARSSKRTSECSDIVRSSLEWLTSRVSRLCVWFYYDVWSYIYLNAHLSHAECRRRSHCWDYTCSKVFEYGLKTHRFFFGSCTIHSLWDVMRTCYANWTFFKFSILLSIFFFSLLMHNTNIYWNGNELQNLAELNHVLGYVCILTLMTTFFSNITLVIIIFEYMVVYSRPSDNQSRDNMDGDSGHGGGGGGNKNRDGLRGEQQCKLKGATVEICLQNNENNDNNDSDSNELYTM